MELFHFNFTVLLLLLLFLEIFLIICDAAGRCLEEENSTLLQLKRGFMIGDLETWQPGTDCCIWEGVTCDEYGRIIVLNLRFRFIIGTIDPSLFNLTSLDTLNLAYNNFDGIAIPDQGWDRLVNLSSLDLSYAGFVGKVPTSISRLKKLNFLDLSCTLKNSLAINPMILQNMSSLKELHLDNVNVSSYRYEWCGVLVNSTPVLEVLSMNRCSLFGTICSSLPMLHFLSFIDFGHNNLDSNIPDSFANFSSLSKLFLQGNNFKGFFPTKIFKLRNLKVLDISYNPLLSVHFLDFPEYSNLNSLSTSNTNFSGNLPDAIGKFKFLAYLDLSCCQFYGTIPASIWNLLGLMFLDLSHNNFNGVVGFEFPSNTISQSHLFWLSLANNNLIGEIAPFICSLTRLKMLDLSKNKLNGTIPSCLLEDGIDLRVLNLEGNQLHGAIPHGISQKCKLKIINMRDNQLEGLLPSDASVRCLEEENSAILQLKKGFITGNLETWQPGTDCCIWEGVTCDENGRIIVLNLRFRFIIGTIDPSLFNLTSLDTLSLAYNKFDGIAIPDHGWDRLVNLSSLDLSYAGFVGKSKGTSS
ncbi:receptor-like protein 7 [Dendrobium catenatum]|uniref:receptor-like protein 7 n=1 Tax=Dendrobium catenatum TaxID=906689 RepID=UPI0009F52C61|nr:receptor-like protein 7 [Dendrobium catenatum]